MPLARGPVSLVNRKSAGISDFRITGPSPSSLSVPLYCRGTALHVFLRPTREITDEARPRSRVFKVECAPGEVQLEVCKNEAPHRGVC